MPQGIARRGTEASEPKLPVSRTLSVLTILLCPSVVACASHSTMLAPMAERNAQLAASCRREDPRSCSLLADVWLARTVPHAWYLDAAHRDLTTLERACEAGSAAACRASAHIRLFRLAEKSEGGLPLLPNKDGARQLLQNGGFHFAVEDGSESYQVERVGDGALSCQQGDLLACVEQSRSTFVYIDPETFRPSFALAARACEAGLSMGCAQGAKGVTLRGAPATQETARGAISSRPRSRKTVAKASAGANCSTSDVVEGRA